MINKDNSYPSVIVANMAQRIMADRIIAWYGKECIEKIAPSNEMFVIVYFKNGSTKLFFCGIYDPEIDKENSSIKCIDDCYRTILSNRNDKEEDKEEIEECCVPYSEEELERSAVTLNRRRR